MSDQNDAYLYVTTIGRKTGNPHEIEIWYVPYNGCYYIVSERRERSDWVQNILKNPAVSVSVQNQQFEGTGRIIDPAVEPETAAAVRALMDAKYSWSEGTIVELKP